MVLPPGQRPGRCSNYSQDVPDISADAYSAIATAAAAFIALGIAVFDHRRRHRDQKDAEMAQARLVHCVHAGPNIRVFNDSRDPIYDARLVRIRRNSASNSIGVASEDLDRLLPGEMFETGLMFGQWDGSGDLSRPQRDDEVSGALQFMDASGLFWERDLGDRETPPRRVLGTKRAGPRMQRITTRHGL